MIDDWMVGDEPNWRVDPRYVLKARSPGGDEYAIVIAMRGISLNGWGNGGFPNFALQIVLGLAGWAFGALRRERKVAVFVRARYTVPRRMRVLVDSAEAAIDLAEALKDEIRTGRFRWAASSAMDSH